MKACAVASPWAENIYDDKYLADIRYDNMSEAKETKTQVDKCKSAEMF